MSDHPPSETPGPEAGGRPWWADNRLVASASTWWGRVRLTAALAVLAALASLALCWFVYLVTDNMPQGRDAWVLSVGLPVIAPLTLAPPLILFLLTLLSELQTRSRMLEQEVGRRRVVEQTLERLVSTDDLTGLANRRAFFQRSDALAGGGRSTVALLDLDHFKRLNDLRGHAAGDEALRTAGRVLADAPGRPFVGRLGGEEFGLLFAGMDPAEARPHLEGLRARFAETTVVTASIGVAAWAPPQTLDDALARADGALYRAKTLGRDRVEQERPGEDAPPADRRLAAPRG
ncbi:MAG: GGDEF domain-containing protein [Thermoleophilia bacterium]|nr:GGDEF domain-containing protein [Thermoleophilia bacterium]